MAWLPYLIGALFLIPLTIGLVLAFVKRPEYRITMDTDTLTLNRFGKPDLIIRRGEVEKIIEERGGIRITTGDPETEMFAPSDLIGFDSLKQDLNSWRPVELSLDDRPMTLVYTLFGSLAVFSIGAFVFHIKVFAYLFFAGLVALFAWQLSRDFKSAVATKSWSRMLVFIVSVLFVGYIVYNVFFGPPD